MLFNAILPRMLQFRNEVMKKKGLSNLVFESYRNLGLTPTAEFLDRLKAFGFGSATLGGVSIGIEDLHIPNAKAELIEEAEVRVERFQRPTRPARSPTASAITA